MKTLRRIWRRFWDSTRWDPYEDLHVVNKDELERRKEIRERRRRDFDSEPWPW